jgi:hypothetical protein
MTRKDLFLFFVAILFLMFFYVIYNSDVFQNAFLANFPALMELDGSGIKHVTTFGNIVTMLLVIISYIIVYIIILNI